DFLYLESEPVDLSIQPFKIWHRIMNVSRRYVHIRDKIVLSVNGSVVQVEEPFGFSISNRITAVRVCGAHSDFSFFKLDSFFFKRFFAMLHAIFVDGFFQLFHIILGCDSNLLLFELAFAGIRFYKRGIGEQLLPFDETMLHGLKYDFIEDLLINLRLLKSPPAVLAENGVMRYRIGQRKTNKPTVGDVDPDLLNQASVRTDSVQVPDHKPVEQHGRRDARTPIILPVHGAAFFRDERRGDGFIDFSKQVILGSTVFYVDCCGLEL